VNEERDKKKKKGARKRISSMGSGGQISGSRKIAWEFISLAVGPGKGSLQGEMQEEEREVEPIRDRALLP